MTLLFIDGCDHVQGASSQNKWDQVVGSGATHATTSGRFSGGTHQVLSTNSGLNKELTGAPATVIFGFAYRQVSQDTASNDIVEFRTSDNSTKHFTLNQNLNGKLSVRDAAGSIVGTGTTNMDTGTWYWVEIKGVVHDTTGTLEVRVNGGAAEISLTSQDTKNGADAGVSWVKVGTVGGAADFWFDDVYICDGAGGVNDDFLGDSRIYTLYPDGAGNSTQFTPDTGNNWERVDEAVEDDDTSYVESSTVTHKDLYTMGALPEDKTIYGVQVTAHAKKTSAGTRKLNVTVRSNVTESDGTAENLTTDYQNYKAIYETDPDTAAAWIKAGVDAMECGMEVNT